MANGGMFPVVIAGAVLFLFIFCCCCCGSCGSSSGSSSSSSGSSSSGSSSGSGGGSGCPPPRGGAIAAVFFGVSVGVAVLAVGCVVVILMVDRQRGGDEWRRRRGLAQVAGGGAAQERGQIENADVRNFGRQIQAGIERVLRVRFGRRIGDRENQRANGNDRFPVPVGMAAEPPVPCPPPIYQPQPVREMQHNGGRLGHIPESLPGRPMQRDLPELHPPENHDFAAGAGVGAQNMIFRHPEHEARSIASSGRSDDTLGGISNATTSSGEISGVRVILGHEGR